MTDEKSPIKSISTIDASVGKRIAADPVPAVWCEHILEPRCIASAAEAREADLPLTDDECRMVDAVCLAGAKRLWLIPMPKANLLHRLKPSGQQKADISAEAHSILQKWMDGAFELQRSMEDGEEFSVTFRVTREAYGADDEPLFTLRTEIRDERTHW